MKKSNFLEGTMIATLAIIITKIMGILYVIPFSSMIGEQGSALYAYAYNIYIIFLDISTAGLPLAISKITKEYSTLKKTKEKVTAYRIGRKMTLILSSAIFVILFLFAECIAKLILGDLSGGNTVEDVAFAIRAVSFAILVIPSLGVVRGYLQGHNIMNVPALSQVIEQIIRILFILGGSFLAIYVFHLSLKTTIGIAVFGACGGGIAALLYVLKKTNKEKKELNLDKVYKEDKALNKEIGKKIIKYATPFIVIALAASINNFMDMVMILRTLELLGIETAKVEFATTAITTWSIKISMIVNAIAVGMTTSLIPTIVESYTLKDWDSVNKKLNQALQLILIISIPMCVGLSLLSKSVWSIFYGVSTIGPKIFAIHIFYSLFFNIYNITNSTLQGLNNFKTVYKSTIIGFAVNIALNIPLMLLCNKIGLEAYYGAIVSTSIGYIASFTIALKTLKKENGLNYKETIKTTTQILIPTAIMIGVVLLLKAIIPVNLASKFSCVLYVAIISILGAISYLFLSYKMGLLNKVLGEAYINKIRKKLTFQR